MTRKEVKIGQKVIDRWYPEKGIGVIEQILKTRVKIRFLAGLETYENAYLYFLDRR